MRLCIGSIIVTASLDRRLLRLPVCSWRIQCDYILVLRTNDSEPYKIGIILHFIKILEPS